MTQRTATQNKQVFSLLNQGELLQQKGTLALSFSNGRTEHTSELTKEECAGLISYLKEYIKDAPEVDRANVMRRKVLAICHQLGWYLRDANEVLLLKAGKPQLDYKHINAFCEKSGMYHKALNDHASHELPGLITQFKKVLNTHLKK